MKIIQIGRSSDNNIVIDDVRVSKIHCQIIQDDYGNYRLIDVNSTNGTYVNGVRCTREVSLNRSDVIRIGNTTLPWQSYFISEYNPPVNRTEIQSTPIVRGRHWFITFWFILGIIGCVISPISAAFQYVQLDSQINYYQYQDGYEQIADQMSNLLSLNMVSTILSVISGIFGIVCIILLFNWKKLGFYGQILSSILFGGISIYLINRIADESGIDASLLQIVPIVSIILGTFIFYAILQIKKNGVKFWDHLEW